MVGNGSCNNENGGIIEWEELATRRCVPITYRLILNLSFFCFFPLTSYHFPPLLFFKKTSAIAPDGNGVCNGALFPLLSLFLFVFIDTFLLIYLYVYTGSEKRSPLMLYYIQEGVSWQESALKSSQTASEKRKLKTYKIYRLYSLSTIHHALYWSAFRDSRNGL